MFRLYILMRVCVTMRIHEIGVVNKLPIYVVASSDNVDVTDHGFDSWKNLACRTYTQLVNVNIIT